MQNRIEELEEAVEAAQRRIATLTFFVALLVLVAVIVPIAGHVMKQDSFVALFN